MTLTEALAPYTIEDADGDLPITSDHVAVEFDVIGGKQYLSYVVLEVGDDVFIKISRPWKAQPTLCLEVETGGNLPVSLEFDDVTARDLAVCLDWASRQEVPAPTE